jgi:hypothetical protein
MFLNWLLAPRSPIDKVWSRTAVISMKNQLSGFLEHSIRKSPADIFYILHVLARCIFALLKCNLYCTSDSYCQKWNIGMTSLFMKNLRKIHEWKKWEHGCTRETWPNKWVFFFVGFLFGILSGVNRWNPLFFNSNESVVDPVSMRKCRHSAPEHLCSFVQRLLRGNKCTRI